jgi:hypothetical protein
MPIQGRCWNLGDGYTLGDGMTLGQLIYPPGDVDIRAEDAFIRDYSAYVRSPTFSVLLGLQGDVTEYVKNISWNRRYKDSLHESNHGRGQVTLLDTDGRFIENGRCTITVNDQIKIWAGFNNTNLPRFAGIVTDPKVNTETHEVYLGIADKGWLLKRSQTSGDYTDYTSPKLMIDKLYSDLAMGVVTYENEDGLPATFELQNLTLEQRDRWSIIHDVIWPLMYVFYLDEDGKLQCNRRDSFNETDIVFIDANVMDIEHLEIAELINKRSVSHSPEIPTWDGWTLGDNLRFGEVTLTKTDYYSVGQYGEKADQEDSPYIGTFANAAIIVPATIDYFSRLRQIFSLKCAAIPTLAMQDLVYVNHEGGNVKGWFMIIGIEEYISAGNFWDRFTILSAPERL